MMQKWFALVESNICVRCTTQENREDPEQLEINALTHGVRNKQLWCFFDNWALNQCPYSE